MISTKIITGLQLLVFVIPISLQLDGVNFDKLDHCRFIHKKFKMKYVFFSDIKLAVYQILAKSGIVAPIIVKKSSHLFWNETFIKNLLTAVRLHWNIGFYKF